MGKIITISTFKGGTGKTLIAANLAEALNKHKKSVCLLDLDPQSNLAISYWHEPDEFNNRSVWSVLTLNQNYQDVLIHLNDSELDLLPSEYALINYEKQLQQDPKLNEKFASLLGLLKQHYDYIIIDTPPQINTLLYWAWNQSDLIISPFLLDLSSFNGVMKLIELTQEYHYPNKILVIPNMITANSAVQDVILNHANAVISELNNPQIIFGVASIPSSTLFTKHQVTLHKPLLGFDYKSKSHKKPIEAFKQLAKLVIKLLKK